MTDTTTFGAGVQWIFFDCFNTILMEPKTDSPYSYLIPIAGLPVRHGLYKSEEEFIADYGSWYKCKWPPSVGNQTTDRWSELPLEERLSELFNTRLSNQLHYHSVEGFRVEKESISALITEMIAHLTNYYLNNLVPSDRIVNTLDHLADKSRLAVVSNFYIAGWPALALDHFGLGAYFDFVLDSAAFGTKKPGVTIYNEALQRAGALPEEVIFVGDSWDNDILLPHHLGMRTVHVQFTPKRRSTTTLADGYQVPSISHWDELVAWWD